MFMFKRKLEEEEINECGAPFPHTWVWGSETNPNIETPDQHQSCISWFSDTSDTGVISRTRHRDSIWWDGRQGQTDWINLHSCWSIYSSSSCCLCYTVPHIGHEWWSLHNAQRWLKLCQRCLDEPITATSAALNDAKTGRCVIAFLDVQDRDDNRIGAA